MEELTHVSSQNSVLQLSKALQKTASAIAEQKKDKSKNEHAIEELNLLKEQCLSNNMQLSLFSAQTLYGLVESGVLEPTNVLTFYMSMLSNANTAMKISVIGEGIINILLMDLKIASSRLKPNDTYACPFGLKTGQHPIITLIQKKNVDLLELANKLNGICSHFDAHVKLNSIEFLRPVFLHVFCNPVQVENAESIWHVLLKQHRAKSPNTPALLREMLTWCRVTPKRCLTVTMQLIDVIELFLELNEIDAALEYQIYLTSLVASLIEFGHDPRNAFNTILNALNRYSGQSINGVSISDYILITMSQIIHSITPFYLRNALEVVKILVERKSVGNTIIRNMMLDSLIIRLAIDGKSLPPPTTVVIERLIKKFRKHKTDSNIDQSKSIDNEFVHTVEYCHPSIVMNFNLTRLSTTLCTELKDSRTVTLKRVIDIAQANPKLTEELHFFLRSVLLSIGGAPFQMWTDLLKLLLASVVANPNMSCDTINFVLHLLAKETEGPKQLELLRALTTFAVAKENIPIILNAYRSLSSSARDVLKVLSVDLHCRLWLAENRTYQFLHKVLTADDDKLTTIHKWEMNIAKAHAIKEICSRKASQHGTDLVAPLSKILNCSSDDDLARSLALDAVTLLCRSNTVNIVSTWNVLKNAFQSKLQPRTVKSLCEFFGEVALLKSSSSEYDLLFRDALAQLFKLIMESHDGEIIASAFRALRNFNFAELTLQHVPASFYENIKLTRQYQIQIAASHSNPHNVPLTAADIVPYVPGICWIELLKNVHATAVAEAIEFVTSLIESEMSQYRSGVYMLQEGRAEPKEFHHLHDRSPLQAMVKYLVEQSADKCETETVLKCLECISKKYSRPIPPLNWFFLIEFINQGSQFQNCDSEHVLNMKRYALNIAAHQIAQSGSAKALMENYLESFDASEKPFNEIQMAVELVAGICDGVSPSILATFLRHTMEFVYNLSASSRFEDKTHFELALKAITKAFDTKCLVPENIDIIIDEVCRFNEVLPSGSKIYEKYSEVILKMPSETLDRLTTPDHWDVEHFQKSLLVRTNAISIRKAFPAPPNPWMWMNLLIDNAIDSKDTLANNEKRQTLLVELLKLLIHSHGDVALSDWIMFFLGKVQSNFNGDSTAENLARSQFSLDVFVFSLVVIAGCATFVDAELSLKNRTQWLSKFPEALWLLSKQSHWAGHMPRIFEFLYHLNTQQSHLPSEYTSIICNTLICVKNSEYFLQKSTWNKFISLK